MRTIPPFVLAWIAGTLAWCLIICLYRLVQYGRKKIKANRKAAFSVQYEGVTYSLNDGDRTPVQRATEQTKDYKIGSYGWR